MTVTQDEVLQAIRDAMANLPPTEGESGITTQEFMEATGCAIARARADLLRLIKAGLLVPVKVFRISPFTGYRVKVPGFRPK